MRVLAVLAHALTALLLAAEARRRFGGRYTDLTVGVLYLLAATAFRPQDAQAANFEVFMLPLMTAAVVLGARRRPAASGATLALATLTKQTAATALLPLAFLAWKFRRARGLAALAVAFAVPILLAAAIFGFHDFFFWVFTGSGGYLDASGVLGYAAGLGARNTAWFVFGSAALIVLAASAWKHWRDDADLWLWVVAGLIAVAAGLRFFPHYYLQLLPPLALLAGRGLVSHLLHAAGRDRARRRARAAAGRVLPAERVRAAHRPQPPPRARRRRRTRATTRSPATASSCGARHRRSTGRPTAGPRRAFPPLASSPAQAAAGPRITSGRSTRHRARCATSSTI